MANVLTEVGTYLASQLSLTQGTTLFLGGIPETPDVMLAIQEYPGEAGDYQFGAAGLRWEYPRIQIVCRGAPNDYSTPRDQAASAHTALAAISVSSLTGTEYLLAMPLQPPNGILGQDDSGRWRISFNCRVWKEPS